MTIEKKEPEKVKPVYYVVVGDTTYLATYDKEKALQLWNILQDNFFRVLKPGSSYMYSGDLRNKKSDGLFFYEGELSDEGGVALKVMEMYVYPSELAAMKAKNAYDKMKETGEANSKNKDVPF